MNLVDWLYVTVTWPILVITGVLLWRDMRRLRRRLTRTRPNK